MKKILSIVIGALLLASCASYHLRQGEKLHEALLNEDEARQTVELDKMFVIKPLFPWWSSEGWEMGQPVPEGFRYTSDTNSEWLTGAQLRALVEPE